MKFVRLAAFGLAAILATSIAACVSNGEVAAKAPEDGGGSKEQVQIKFSWWGGDSRHEATEKAIAAFEERYPDIKVIPEYGAWTGWEEKQSLNILGGNTADVMQINWNWIESFSQGGKSFVNLEDYSDLLDLTQFPQESLDQCRAGDKLAAVPIALTGRLFFWNKTTFDKVGCEIPTSTESLLAAGKAFQAYDPDSYPLALGPYDRAIFFIYYLESVYGKPWVVDETVNYTVEEIQSGMDFLVKLEKEHVIPTLATIDGDMADSLDKNAKWIDGKYAGIYEWDSALSKCKKSMEESANVPGQEFVIGDFIRFGDFQGGFQKVSMCYAVSAKSEHPRESAMLINFLLNDPAGIEISSTERGIPCSKEGVRVLKEKGIGDELTKEANALVLAFSKFPLDPKFESNDLKANPDGVYYKVFGKLSSGDIDSKEAAKELLDGVTECLEG